MAKEKRIYRSKKDKIIAGVCGGIGEYTGSDPTLWRLLWALVTVFSGIFPGILIYLLAWIIIPERN